MASKEYNKSYREQHPGRTKTAAGSRDRALEINWRLRQKDEVLSVYGHGSSLSCCWPGCLISDIDMLTLDHINNDGGEHRRLKRRTGNSLYGFLKREGYPAGYQTLCMNHQLKKEITRRRELSHADTSIITSHRT